MATACAIRSTTVVCDISESKIMILFVVEKASVSLNLLQAEVYRDNYILHTYGLTGVNSYGNFG